MKFDHLRYGLSFNIGDQGGLCFIVIEDHETFECFTMDLYRQINRISDHFLLSDDKYVHLDMSKECDLIFSPLDLRFDKRIVQKPLLSRLNDEICDTPIELQISNYDSMAASILDDINMQSEFDLDYGDDFGIMGFLKHYDLHIQDPEGYFTERLESYTSTIINLSGRSVFFIANCDAYIGKPD